MPHMTPTSFRAVRVALGMKQSEFGALIGMRQSHVSETERGVGGRSVSPTVAACIRRMAETDSARAAVIREVLRRAEEE